MKYFTPPPPSLTTAEWVGLRWTLLVNKIGAARRRRPQAPGQASGLRFMELSSSIWAESRARNPRWEPGMGMIPDPRQIGDGDGDSAPGWTIPGKSGMGMGMDPRSPANRGSGMGMIPDCRRVPSCT